MADAKTFASLSPRLLARKGTAKPAMRPQLQPLVEYSTSELEPNGFGDESQAQQDIGTDDLGWNDMGEAPGDAADTANILPFGAGEGGFEAPPLTTGKPEVVRRRDALAGKIEAGKLAANRADANAAPIELAAHRWSRTENAGARRSALAEGRRAAFTLRVDGDRHLKLRLACTVEGRSAQQLVTEALDRLLDTLPELDDLARRVKRR